MESKRRFACVLIALYSFFTAIVRDGLGPFVSVYLVVGRGYSAGLAGVLWTIREISMTASLAPLGNLFDMTEHKVTWLIAFTALSSCASSIIVITDTFWILVIRSIFGGLAASAIPPGVSSLTLGIVGADLFDTYMPANERAEHAGSLCAAAMAAAVAYSIYPHLRWIFLSIGAFSALGIVCLAIFPAQLVNHRASCGLEADDMSEAISESDRRSSASSEAGDSWIGREDSKTATYCSLLKNRNILIYAFSVMLFHFGNAAILPLLGQLIAFDSGRIGMVWAASLIIIAQLSSIPATLFLKLSSTIGHKGVVLICYLTVPTRAILIIVIVKCFNANKFALAATQLIDGIGAGINGVGVNSVTRLLTQGTGRFGVTLGAVIASWQTGAALSNVIGGVLADVSYVVAFIFLGACGVAAALALLPLRIKLDVEKESLGSSSSLSLSSLSSSSSSSLPSSSSSSSS